VSVLDPLACDRARIARDRRFDGQFFTGVKTTGIYCRPICPVKPARSANVRYFPSAAAAERAGFLPCLRCCPEAAPGTLAWDGPAAILSRALQLVDRGYLDEHAVAELAGELAVGVRQLNRIFARHLGASPLRVAHTHRVQTAKRLLAETRLPITQVALPRGSRACDGLTPRSARRTVGRPHTSDGPVAVILRVHRAASCCAWPIGRH
jgi:methylphosphotriester-DNA--protein-cysteine methyltransferase